ncbi:Magnesium transporter MgtE [Lentibacillus sp. JNUCC-1]|uniref:magnesium transporter n=1 Tax=Lentibacillus sp. JNUCC-1 TaxID=2654513 RepID=UPI0012E71DB7|nr:magnesium transporter [Lentibacillus sp. JNUCC-1]MUV37236.1 Magnesium transporter MgtE [Lentibacillus sp. JNUCC-1]
MIRLRKNNREPYIEAVLNALHAKQEALFRTSFLELHPADQADTFLRFDAAERQQVYAYLAPDELAVLYDGLEVKNQVLFFEEMDEGYFSEVLNHMFTDDVVMFLNDIDEEQAANFLKKMAPEKAKKIETLLAYEPETAGAILTKEFVTISSADSAEQVIEHLRKEAPGAEIIYYNYVVDEAGALAGVVSLRDLITAAPDEPITNIMSRQVVSVPDDMDQEDVAKVIQKYDLLAVPVVTEAQQLLGIVTVDDVIDIIELETTEDFGEISATKGATDLQLSAFTAAKKRTPWIITLMFFGLITAGVIGRFEDTLEQIVLLAVFIPMIMDSAGNVGTQSLAVSVRGLALGTVEHGKFWRMIRREFSTGFLIGLLCMIIVLGIIPLIYGEWLIAFIVGVSILCTLSISAVIGSVVPLVINKLKFDPAIASGPFITTLNDITGLLIYFTIATSLLDRL